MSVKCAVTVVFTSMANVHICYDATRISSHESLATPSSHKFTIPHHSVHVAHGIARVHDENKNILLLLLKMVKFIKYFFGLIIHTINTRINE